MYDGYLTFDATEVINMERLMAYVDAGIVPAGVAVEDCTGTCEGLGEAVGDGPYTSPMQDEPPWFDPHDPDTLDFAGVLPLEITGLDGSVRTVEVVNLVTRGGVPMRPQYGPRTVAVSALLLGRTSAGVESGLRWLTNVLHRVCTTPSCQGAPLEAFTSCPTPICEGSDNDESLSSTNQPYSVDTWLAAGGHTSDADTFLSDAPRVATNLVPNPSGEYGIGSWHKDPVMTAWAGCTVQFGGLPDITPKSGTKAIRLLFPIGGTPAAASQTITGLVAGRSYTYTAGLNLPSAQGVNVLSANASSIETDATAWACQAQGLLVRSTAWASLGTHSLSVAANTTNPALENPAWTVASGLVIGRQYVFQADVMVPTNAPDVRLVANFQQNATPSLVTRGPVYSGKDTTTRLRITFTANQSTAQVGIAAVGCSPNAVFLDNATVNALAPNLLTANQSSMETDASGWAPEGSGTVLNTSTVRATVGAKSLYVLWSTTTPTPFADVVVNGLVIGHRYRATARVWVSQAPAARLTVPTEGATGALSVTSGAWETIGVDFTATSTARTVRLAAGGTGVAGGETWVDDVQVVESPAPAVVAYVSQAGASVDSPPCDVTDQWITRQVKFVAAGTTAEVGVRTLGASTIANMCHVDDLIVLDDLDVLPAGTPAYFDGDTPTSSAGDFRWTGTAGGSTSVLFAPVPALLAGPVFAPQGRFIADWTVNHTPAEPVVQVWVGAVSEDGGTVLDQQGPYAVTASQMLRWDVSPAPQTNFRPAMWVLGIGADFALTTWSQPALSPAECIAPYRRTYPAVTTVEGPTVTGQEVTNCGDRFLYVTWTWVSGSPYRYGVREGLLVGLTSSVQETQQVAGVIGTPMGQIAATPYNCPEPSAPVTCATDPCYAGFTAPPAGPIIPDAKRPNITTQQVRACSVYVPGDLTPKDDGVFSFILANDTHDKVGVRVRVYEDVPATGAPSDLCDFAYEYLIDYIAPEAVFHIDGITSVAEVLCDGALEPVDASSVVRGSYGGPAVDPVARCGKSYYVVVMWLATYPWSCPATGTSTGSIYKAGDPEGELTLAVGVTDREG